MNNKAHIFKKNNNYYMFDGNSFCVYKLDNRLKNELDNMNESQLKELIEKLNINAKYNLRDNSLDSEYCSRLVLNLSNKCNLRCHYCYANGGSYGNENLHDMSEDTIMKSIDLILKIYPHGLKIIQFFGGEPLINRQTMYNCIPKINNIFNSKGLNLPQYTIVTNGTLINDEDIKMFNEYFTSVTISLDGCKEVNDSQRVYANKELSVYDCVVDTIKKMNSHNRKFALCIESTLTKYHLDEIEMYGFAKSVGDLYNLGIDFHEYAPAFDIINCGLTMSELPIAKVSNYLKEFIDESIINAEKLNQQQSVLTSMKKILNKKISYPCTCGATKTDIAVDVDGYIYPCFMFIGIKEFMLSNVNSFDINTYLKNREKSTEILKTYIETNECEKCWISNLCGITFSHCIGARYLIEKSYKNKKFDICELSRNVTEHIISKVVE